MFHKSASGFLCQPFFRTVPGCPSLLQSKERLLHLQELPEVKKGCKVTPATVPAVPKPRGEVQNTQSRLKQARITATTLFKFTKKSNKVHKKVVKKTSTTLNFSTGSRLTLLLQKCEIKLGCRTVTDENLRQEQTRAASHCLELQTQTPNLPGHWYSLLEIV